MLSFAAGYLDHGRSPGESPKGPIERLLIPLGVREISCFNTHHILSQSSTYFNKWPV